MIRRSLIAAALAALIVACARTPPPPVVVPQGEARFIVDPRIGWNGPSLPAVDKAFDTAWRYAMAGNSVAARDRLDALRSRNPDYAPAALAEAALAIHEGKVDEARAIVDRLVERYPEYTAANIYAAEMALTEGRVRDAYDRYRVIVTQPAAPPTATERLAQLQTKVFDELYNAALTASNPEAIRLLREALTINPSATAARTQLVQRLLAQQKYDEARKELDPLVNSAEADRPDVQESLAEIDVGRGRYQQAINRYERLSRNDVEGRYARRLAQIKEQFAQANMPPQYLRALDAESITRADLAVLLYWKVAAIRFAQDVPAPPIAIDVTDVPGRDELVRAIALGIFPVDPITRRVNPSAEVNAAALVRTATRVLAMRGASCARGAPNALTACSIDDPTTVGTEVSVSGRTAAALLDQVDRALR